MKPISSVGWVELLRNPSTPRPPDGFRGAQPILHPAEYDSNFGNARLVRGAADCLVRHDVHEQFILAGKMRPADRHLRTAPYQPPHLRAKARLRIRWTSLRLASGSCFSSWRAAADEYPLRSDRDLTWRTCATSHSRLYAR